MEIDLNMLVNNFWFQQIIANSIALLSDYSFKKLEEKSNKNDLLWQLLHCLQQAHYYTCEQLGWEYDPNAFIELSKTILTDNISICNEANIISVFATAVGHPINKTDAECWVNNFQIQLVSEEHRRLWEYIKLKHLFSQKEIPEIQKRYIEKFEQIVIYNDSEDLFLYQLYIPNEYSIYNEKSSNNDLLDLVDAFVYGNVETWSNTKGIDCSNETNTLFVFGHQCTGKSTLLSKIIYDHYVANKMNEKQIHIVSFNDRSLKNNDLTPYSICNYLSLKTNSLSDAVLIIDGLDESEWPVAVASDKIEYLINDLKEYNCKLIVTSRPNYQYYGDLNNVLNIYLKPFSIDQATKWIELFKECSPAIDSEKIKNQIMDLKPDIRKVILIPYVFYTCVKNDIQFNLVTEIARLYDIVFSNKEAKLLTTPYNNKSRNIQKNLLQFKKVITDISKYALSTTNNLIPLSFFDKLLSESIIDSNKITSEFLLYRKDYDSIAFIHNSIPSYFVSRNLYEVFISCFNSNNYEELIYELDYFRKNDMIISASVIEFIEYFVRQNNNESLQFIDVLKHFLSGCFDDYLIFNVGLKELQRYYYSYFISITKIVFAFVSPQVRPYTSYDFFNLLSINEKENFIKYTKLGQESLDCISICSFSDENLNEINLNGINLRGKLMRRTSIHNANFKGSNLSGAYFINSDYSLCCFDDSNCKNIDFSGSILFGASFKNARLNGANFTDANLNGVDFRGAKLNKCNFNGASVQGVKIFVEQLRFIFDFDIDYIIKNQIEVYRGEEILHDGLLEEEYKKQRPVSYSIYKFGNNKK